MYTFRIFQSFTCDSLLLFTYLYCIYCFRFSIWANTILWAQLCHGRYVYTCNTNSHSRNV